MASLPSNPVRLADVEIKPASQPFVTELEEAWAAGFARLKMERDGRKYITRDGAELLGHDLKSNPLLCDTMDKIAKRYIPWIARKTELRVMLRDLLRDDKEVTVDRMPFLLEINALDHKLAILNFHVLQDLAAADSGLKQEMDRHADEKYVNKANKFGQQVLRSIITVLIEPYYRHFPDMRRGDQFVPQTARPGSL